MLATGTESKRTAPPRQKRTTVFLLEPLALVCDCLRSTIEANGYRVVGHAHTGQEALKKIPSLRPSVVFSEIDLPDCSGLELCQAISQQVPAVALVVLTARDDAETRVAALLAGATAFVTKRTGFGALMANLRDITAPGQSLHSPGKSQLPIRIGLEQQVATLHASLQALTPREREVAMLAGRGLTNKEMASELNVSATTVRNHLSSIMRKLPARSRAEVAALVALAGWLQ